MLSIHALNASLPLATVLDNHDLILTPIPGTPLEALVAATRSDPNFNTVNPVDNGSGVTVNEYVPDVVNIEYIANVKDEVLNTSKHDLAMDDIVEVASKAVREHMVFAKNVVAPAVENLVTRTMNKLATMTPSSILGMEVIVKNPPQPLMNSTLDDAVHKFSDLPFDVPTMNMRMPTITASEIIELMKSGAAGMDKAIDEWAAEKGESFFINLWENVFQIKQADLNERENVTFKTWIYDKPDATDNALAIYLLARKLEDGPLENTEMNLATYNKTIIEYRNHSAAKLSHVLDEMDQTVKSGLLVRSMTDNTIVVDGRVYAKWIADGGENEVLFGNLLSTPSSVSVSDINSRAAELKEVWNRHAVLISTVERNRKFSRTKEILMHEFIEQMREVTEDEVGTLENRERIVKSFGEILDDLREDELVDLWDACLKLLCGSRFIRTEARQILLGIDRVKKENPNIDIRECAAISMIEYVAKWVGSQLKPTVV